MTLLAHDGGDEVAAEDLVDDSVVAVLAQGVHLAPDFFVDLERWRNERLVDVKTAAVFRKTQPRLIHCLDRISFGSGCSTAVEHTHVEQNSRGRGFYSSRRQRVLNQVPQRGATLLIFCSKKWMLSCVAWGETGIICKDLS